VGLSAGQLSRLCREALGLSSLDVVNARVVHEAERELVYSTLGIKQIAAVLGFEDDAYFGRFFRKQTGRTPSEFRQAARLRLAPEAETKARARP
jgi:AraC family transcriptional regulator, transcriptional activator of pobA